MAERPGHRRIDSVMARWLATLSKFSLFVGAVLLMTGALRRARPRAAIDAIGTGLTTWNPKKDRVYADASNTAASAPPPPANSYPATAVTTRNHGTQLSSFTKGLLWLGLLLVCFVVGDLIVRGFQREIAKPVWELSRDDTDLGRQAIIRHGCGGCHVIPGIRHATGRVGPRLSGFGDQIYIAGMLPNIPENLTLWIQNPQAVNPQSAMPNLGVSEAEAREIAVYLYAQP